jgi:hypothetical protein
MYKALPVSSSSSFKPSSSHTSTSSSWRPTNDAGKADSAADSTTAASLPDSAEEYLRQVRLFSRPPTQTICSYRLYPAYTFVINVCGHRPFHTFLFFPSPPACIYPLPPFSSLGRCALRPGSVPRWWWLLWTSRGSPSRPSTSQPSRREVPLPPQPLHAPRHSCLTCSGNTRLRAGLLIFGRHCVGTLH